VVAQQAQKPEITVLTAGRRREAMTELGDAYRFRCLMQLSIGWSPAVNSNW
jgi:hypothetical protein